ncbi:hypothetical protein DFH09DRAFT_1379428 [Mycena vulgaris]|nr:hypothetical protein DFH09DRAFT_1379428 [Mycena vulgaris]
MDDIDVDVAREAYWAMTEAQEGPGAREREMEVLREMAARRGMDTDDSDELDEEDAGGERYGLAQTTFHACASAPSSSCFSVRRPSSSAHALPAGLLLAFLHAPLFSRASASVCSARILCLLLGKRYRYSHR